MAIGSATEEKPKKQGRRPSNMLAPGFRFHPTDEELVRYYLRRKVCGKGFRIDAISDVDIYKIEPWDLPSYSKLNTRDLEWYFFSMLDKKYGNGAKTNRATDKGYWKTTGKDRAVYHKSQIVGMKKTLVYHIGRAPKGQRTNWVMHEYKLTDLELEKAGIAQDAFVLCRVFQKSGTGPKNGEQYGAPFVEEEWEEDDLESVPPVEAAEDFDFSNDFYLDADDLEQILGPELPADATSPLILRSSDGSSGEEVIESFINSQQLLVGEGEQYQGSDELDDGKLYYTLAPSDNDVKQVKHEYIGESSKSGELDYISYLLDEPVPIPNLSLEDLQFPDIEYFDADEFVTDMETNNNTSALDMVDEYLSFFDSDNGDQQNLPYDSSMMHGNEALISDQALLPPKELDEGTSQGKLTNGKLPNANNNDVPSSSSKLDSPEEYEPDFQYPFTKQASQMLADIPAPLAFAAEYPSKDAIQRLNALSQPSSSVHVTAGMVQIRNMNAVIDHESPLEKPWSINVTLSLGYSQQIEGNGLTDLQTSVSVRSGKAISSLSVGWICFLFFWVLFISTSLKMKAFVLAN